MDGARDRLEEAALQYGRMVRSQYYVEKGFRIVPCGTDVNRMTLFFAEQLQYAALELVDILSAQPLPPRKT
jgi:hypothetical protein